jgi:hypothetical protein
MTHRLESRRISTESEYSAARRELDALLGAIGGRDDGPHVDELIELIENYETSVRFIPDWSGETYRNAA